jgi:peptidoglycan hydrolase CwlO-like protein
MKKSKLIIASILIGIFSFVTCSAALEESIDLPTVCEDSAVLDAYESMLSKKDFQELLEKCQTYLSALMIQTENQASEKGEEKETLESEISSLTRMIQSLNNKIYQTSLNIKSLEYQIDDTTETIETTKTEIDEQKEKIGLILQAVYEKGEKSPLEIFLTSGSISSFLDNFIYLEILNNKNQSLLAEYEDLQVYLGEQKETLEVEKIDQETYAEQQEVQRNASYEIKQETEYLYSITEQEYQEILANKEDLESKKAEIEKRLISLAGLMPGQEAPEFGTLLNIAKTVSANTGIRAALVLGIISQESALGRNVGMCYINDSETGGGTFTGGGTSYKKPDGTSYTNGGLVERIIHYNRDLPVFIEMMQNLGYDYTKVPVSCWVPICSNGYKLVYGSSGITISADGTINCPSGYYAYGFGGAMGPSQFIPSTWNIHRTR